ncbi:FAD-dependent monooxygenase [Flavilitoribacter nigricans]|uniref:Monooxygenase n=1 Tax=Flavilitoribacter nigricans (strain ATCC 23147 / DSM 23189 / NBRC 102662 / NCIMB 1420 / SS-2) TaxID=1122177 RepID=A0A2D0NDF9_FLAN2|nr:FAD-dependent monooxygenase [Flavilitoribacter nigricans]PHN06554.1 monooxygenase [Flavilitoribacter nigricans DSM 23189 = NBRC 102662]
MDIIGAGIGGLTTAIALQQKGITSNLYEQAKAIQPVGAGIILANNAMQVYEKLGLRKELEAAGNPISAMKITDPQLKPISEVDLAHFEKKYQVRNIAIHRGALQQILAERLPKNTVHLGHELIRVDKDQSAYVLHFKHGAQLRSSQLLGADGLNSVLRQSLFNENTIRNAKQVCWRGVTDFTLPKPYRHELNEAWGIGDRVGFVQIAPNQAYWYALKSFLHDPGEYPLGEINEYYRDYHPVIRELIRSTPLENIHTAVISDLAPIKTWHRENVCLLGDAAHATTPNMGQGACQSIEDAYILSACLAKYELNRAFAEFQRLRMPKAHQVVNTSWRLGKIAHWQHPLAITLRNQLLRLTPQSISQKQSARIFQLEQV